ncbi:MAG: isocitrate lyase/PEP mutase family protein, partial [Sphingomicrobium sp.]
MRDADKTRSFADLHVAGDPLILFNAWDAGSAAAVAKSGARAVATGSVSVANAHGFQDGEQLPIELALANAARVVSAVGLPVTIDFEGGYAAGGDALAANIERLAATGAVGCNLEDQIVATENLYSIAEQADRIRTARRGAGADFFINARTDLFLKVDRSTHDRNLADAAIERGLAYSEAGANSFFIPSLADLQLVELICRSVPLPLNAMHFPGAPTRA